VKLTIPGNVPSQKNGKRIVPRGNRSVIISSEAVLKWKKLAIEELRRQFNGYKVTDYPINITLVFYFDNERRHDLDNAAAGVMDALAAPWETHMVPNKRGKLVERGIAGTGVITDDSVKYVDCLTLQYGGIDKINPRAEIYFDE
jgi:hypothetical protein